MTVKLGTINRVLHCFGLCLYVSTWDGKGERTPTTLSLEFIGLPGTARRVAWDKRWFTPPTTMPDPDAAEGTP